VDRVLALRVTGVLRKRAAETRSARHG
jgi:hypothetical protein